MRGQRHPPVGRLTTPKAQARSNVEHGGDCTRCQNDPQHKRRCDSPAAGNGNAGGHSRQSDRAG